MKNKGVKNITYLLKTMGLTAALSVSMVAGVPYVHNNSLYVVSAASYTGTVTGVDSGGLRVRSSADTSSLNNVITKVYTGDTFDVLDTVYNGSSKWYKIGFMYKGEYSYGYVSADYVTVTQNNTSDDNNNSDNDSDYDYDTDFEAMLTKQGFPESYKDGLRQIHQKYPKWVFKADHINRSWNDIIENENVLGRSLVYGYAKDSWKSKAEGAYNSETGEYTVFDSGGWVQASSALVEYAIDPRNFLNETNIFMFEDLSYSSSIQSEQGVKNVISGTFMDSSSHSLEFNGVSYTYASGLMYAGSVSGVSPYHLATRIIQEQGYNGQGLSISGTVAGYEGLFNYYNQGAYKSGSISAVENGLIYASKNDPSTYRAWNTRMKSIVGGAKILGANYINKGQNTLYYEKFDMITPYSHQYMTFILAPRQESVTASKAYSQSVKLSTALTFTIPVYNDMPYYVCGLPDDDDNNNNNNNNNGNDDNNNIVMGTDVKLASDGNWYYYVNGKIDYSYTGLAQNINGWWYINNGVVDFSYNGVVQNQFGWWKVTNGGVDFGYTGLAQNEYGWWYVVNGGVDFGYTGFASNEYGTWYVNEGQVRFYVTGLVGNGYDWRYVVEGCTDTSVNGLVQNENGWWKVTNGSVDFNYTGLAQNENGWWYVVNGGIDFGYTGFASNEVGTWYVSGGQVRFDVTGLVGVGDDLRYVTGGLVDTSVNTLIEGQDRWYYINNGVVDYDYAGLVQNENGWWYVTDGYIDFGYTGFAGNEYGTWYVNAGQVGFDVTGLVGVASDWRCVTQGLMDTSVNGLVQNENGWWYVANGRVDFTFTGLVENELGWWYVVNGGIDFNYTGQAQNEYGTWNVVNGKVIF